MLGERLCTSLRRVSARAVYQRGRSEVQVIIFSIRGQFRLRVCVSLVHLMREGGGEDVHQQQHTSGSTVECVKSVRLVALDSGRSLSLGTGSEVEVVMMGCWCATMRYRTRPESCRGGGETQRNG
jgi:hypothetical protein